MTAEPAIMVISRERYLDDTKRFALELSLVTRSGLMHSLLSNMPAGDRDAVGDILVGALDAIEERLRPHVAAALRA
jgi:hypothetical protein